jgi:hypothetical protein
MQEGPARRTKKPATRRSNAIHDLTEERGLLKLAEQAAADEREACARLA